MHRYAGRWYKGPKDVYEFIGRHIVMFEEPSLRIYEHARNRAEVAARRGLPDSYWQEFVMDHLLTGPKRVAWDLLLDDSSRSDNERAREFARVSGMSERTFYYYAYELRMRMEEATGDAAEPEPEEAARAGGVANTHSLQFCKEPEDVTYCAGCPAGAVAECLVCERCHSCCRCEPAGEEGADELEEIVMHLEQDPSYESEDHRVEAFEVWAEEWKLHGSRAIYRRLKAKLEQEGKL
jgi:hypothetical protein